MSWTFIGRGRGGPSTSAAQPAGAEPKLYEWYSRDEAIAFFGPPTEAASLCNGQWLMFPHTVVCLATIGAAPRMSHFAKASRFCWVADQPYHVSGGRYTDFVPANVMGDRTSKPAIRLFVRPQQSVPYLYVGELEPSYVQQAPGPQNHGMAEFDLRSALPSDVWVRLGGLVLGDLDVAPVDRALDLLHGPTSVEERFDILRELVEYWHGPIGPQDGMSDEELAGWTLPLPLPRGGTWRLPLPLLRWYRWAGKRDGILSGQNILLTPKNPEHPYYELTIEDDRLLFYLENQAVYRWATLPEGEDPPVFGRYETTDPWEQEDVTLSEHLILACLLEAMTCHAPYGASVAWLHEDKLAEIVKTIPPLAIAPWRWLGPMQFYARGGAFMYAAPNGEPGYSVWIGAKTEQPLQFLKPLVDDTWEYVAI